jgi:cullin-associated NEDD8-dissociated protein 1
LGEYPDDLTDTGPLNIGRGRLIPTTSWEAVWNAVARWFGVTNELMSDVLPNLANFPADEIFDENDLFV